MLEFWVNLYMYFLGLTLDAVYGKTAKKAVEEGKASKEWSSAIKIY